jgi:MFS family permease
MKRLSASTVLVCGSLMIAAAGAFFALRHGALWEAFVAMGAIGIGFGFTFATIPGLIARAAPRRETGSAMGLYQVIRSIGFSLGSALTAAILASNLTRGATQVTEQGYVEALWVGSAVCVFSAGGSWLLSHGENTMAPEAMAAADRRRLALDEAELATAGVVGIEGGQT